VETLYVATSVSDTSYLDRSRRPDTAYEYRLAVVNQSGLSAETPVQVVPGYSVAGARLLAAEPDSLTGAVSLRWTRYHGPGFQRYRVFRRVAERLDEEELAHPAAAIDTTLWRSGRGRR
jgi:hypothetical protein